MTAFANPAQPTPHPIDRLYHFVASDRVLAVVLALTVLALLVGLLLPQAPTETEPQDTARWLAETAERYGSLGGVMQAAGLFNLWRSPWLQGLLGLLAFVLLLRLGLAVGEAWQRLRQPAPLAAARYAQNWPWQVNLRLAEDGASVASELANDLRSEGWRTVQESGEQATYLVAERSAWGLLAAPVFYLGLLVVLAGLWLGAWAGWRETGVILSPEQAVRLAHDADLTLTVLPQADGVMVQRGAGPALEKTFPVLGAAHAAGVSIRRIGAGQALIVSGRGADGAPVLLQPVEHQSPAQERLTLVFDQPRAERLFLAPASQLVFSVVAFPALPERGFSGPTYLVQAFPAGQQTPVANQFVAGDADLAVGDAVFTLKDGRFVAVEVSRNPGLPVTLAGAVLALAAAAIALWRPAGRLAVTVQRQRQGVQVTAALQASRLWRAAFPWLSAWTLTYSREGQSIPTAPPRKSPGEDRSP